MSQELAPGAATTGCELLAEQEAERDRQLAARLLLDIAGDAPEHIVMNANPDNPKKYVTVHRPLTLADMRQHLAGRRTLGASLQHQDGTTRALCFDADNADNWSQLENAARQLASTGYRPLLEPSPAGRGGHLWLIFSERVNAAAARQQVITVAAGLEQIVEYWPSRGKQKVRLPAGRYVTPTFAQWTTLIDGSNQEKLKNEPSERNRLNILLANITPAALIPDAAPAAPAPARTVQTERSAQRQPRPPAEPDEYHRRKYGADHKMWVAFDEQFLIDRFNSEHSIGDLAAYERSGMINAAAIGRPERTASVGVTRDGQRFTDFGAGAMQPDGTPDGGDPFEFYIRSQQLDKAAVLRELGRDLNRSASSEILRAARAGEPLPAWVLDIITPTGQAIYNQNAARHGHPPLEAYGGLAGFSTPEQEQPQEQPAQAEAVYTGVARLMLSGTGELWQPEQQAAEPDQPQAYEGDHPPPRPCICCNVTAWQWAGDRYICANPGHSPA